MSSALLHRPRSQAELAELLGRLGDDAKIVAGGTAFTILRKAGLLRPEHVISMHAVPDLDGLDLREDVLSIGALTRFHRIAGSSLVRRSAPVLGATIRLVANARVRNVATIGGNVSESDPTSDPPGVLSALDALIHVVSEHQERDIPATDFFKDYFETALRPDEFVSRVSVPLLAESWGGSYVKFLSRSAEDRTCVGVAAFADCGDDGVLRGLRVAVVGVAPIPLRVRSLEDGAVGASVDDRLLNSISDDLVAASDPIADVRGSAEYRQHMMRVLIPIAIRRAMAHENDAVFI